MQRMLEDWFSPQAVQLVVDTISGGSPRPPAAAKGRGRKRQRNPTPEPASETVISISDSDSDDDGGFSIVIPDSPSSSPSKEVRCSGAGKEATCSVFERTVVRSRLAAQAASGSGDVAAPQRTTRASARLAKAAATSPAKATPAAGVSPTCPVDLREVYLATASLQVGEGAAAGTPAKRRATSKGGFRASAKKSPKAAVGIGYSGSTEDAALRKQAAAALEAKSQADALQLVAALKRLRRALPATEPEPAVAEALVYFLCLGCVSPSDLFQTVRTACPAPASLAGIASSLLQNSLMHLSQQPKLASVAVSTLSSIASLPCLRAVLRFVPVTRWEEGLTPKATMHRENGGWSAKLRTGMPLPHSLAGRLQRLAAESKTLLGLTDTSTTVVEGADAADFERQQLMATQICEANDTITAQLGSGSLHHTPSLSRAEAYKAALVPLAFGQIRGLAAQHSLAGRPQQQGVKAVAAPRSIRQLMRVQQELARSCSEHVHLGASIFLRADLARCDVLRATVSGPADTPYAYGLFNFDIQLPPGYPKVSPQVVCTSTNGGTVRLNPNLYANGKVCLSLLGTWSGPGWDPDTSTLSQVLLSVQSLIFSEHPIANEPGFEVFLKRGHSAANRFYEACVRLATLQVGILGPLQFPALGLAEVSKQFFAWHAKDILHMLSVWEAKAVALPAVAQSKQLMQVFSRGMTKKTLVAETKATIAAVRKELSALSHK